jgi:uncharacterized membrane-anchored protein YitT (DUF2179 family)
MAQDLLFFRRIIIDRLDDSNRITIDSLNGKGLPYMGFISVRPYQTKRPFRAHRSFRMPTDSGRAIGKVLWNLMLITGGSIICAICLNGILVPKDFMSGGFVGISLVMNHFFPFIPIPAAYVILNIPVFCLGWKYVGRRFFVYSVIGTAIFAMAATRTPFVVPVNDKILSAILAGLLMGAGSGLILRSYGSAGGMDILSIILLKKYAVRLGTSILVLNALIIGAAIWFVSIESALYTLVYFYVSTQIVNLVVNGLSQRKAIHIISTRWEDIRRALMASHNRGVTMVDCSGGFSGRQMQMLFTVVPFQDLSGLKQTIHQIDPAAFVVVSDTLEVMGNRIGNQPHW